MRTVSFCALSFLLSTAFCLQPSWSQEESVFSGPKTGGPGFSVGSQDGSNFGGPGASSQSQFGVATGSPNFTTGPRSGYTMGAVRFLSFGPLDDEVKSNMKEDCATFGHLISKSVPLVNRRTSMGVSVEQSFGKNEVMYIQGAGLVFIYHVGFQVAQGEDGRKTSQTEEKPTNDWDLAKKAVSNQQFGGPQSPFYGMRSGGFADSAHLLSYDQEQVAKLNSNIAKALGHIGRFRSLGQYETITVYVHGAPVKSGTGAKQSVMAWRAKRADVGSDETLSEDKIEVKQYLQQTTSTSNFSSSGYSFHVGSGE